MWIARFQPRIRDGTFVSSNEPPRHRGDCTTADSTQKRTSLLIRKLEPARGACPTSVSTAETGSRCGCFVNWIIPLFGIFSLTAGTDARLDNRTRSRRQTLESIG